MNNKNILPCQIPELKLSCYGCCSPDLGTKKELEIDIEQNTIEFDQISLNPKKPTKKELIKFKTRFAPEEVPKSGICFNLIDFGNSCLACPLHNKINEIISKEKYLGPKEDLRINHCDINYECETFKLWKLVPQSQRLEYIKFLKNKKLNHYKYSTGNLKAKYLKEFFKKRNQIIN